MLRWFIIILCLVPTLHVSAQTPITIQGRIYNPTTRRPPAGSVNVILRSVKENKIYTYSTAQPDGKYTVTYEGYADSLIIMISGFNIKEQAKVIPALSQQIDFAAEEKALNIREVIVKAPAIIRRQDTLTYNVAEYTDATDHSIGDVLKKLPGIQVSQTGEITYNGKAINKFYVENMDMLEGRYGIATNNIQAKDIASIQVYENHQPVKVLQKLVNSNHAAINLKLREDAKGAWNVVLLLGGGYKPTLWNAEGTAMLFRRKFQTINVYKSNNTGNDVAQELRPFYGNTDIASSLLGIHAPTEPELNEERYLNNHVHTLSLNTIAQLRRGTELTTNAHYIHDSQRSKGTSVTTYYLAGQTPVVIEEQTSANYHTDLSEIHLQLCKNADNHYLQEKITFNGEWMSNAGNVLNNGNIIHQHFQLPKITLKNQFTDIHRYKKWSVNFHSMMDYASQPTSLRICPILYPEIFNQDSCYGVFQTLNSQRFRINNSAFTTFTIKRWTFMLHTNLNMQMEWMDSRLSPINEASQIFPVPDSMRNDIYWRKSDAIIGLSSSYQAGNKFNIHLSIPFDFINLSHKDKISVHTHRINNLFIKPNLLIEASLSRNLKLSAQAFYQEIVGNLYDSYTGYIMSNYRIIANKEGNISRNKKQSYSASLSYGNAFSALFGGIESRYWRSHCNLLHSTVYEGSLSHTQAYHINNISNGWSIEATGSKYFGAISSTFRLSGGYFRSQNKQLRQGKLMQTRFNKTNVGFRFDSHFAKTVRLSYESKYFRYRSHIKDEERLPPINVLTQNAAIYFIMKKNFICRLGGEHYYNTAVYGNDRNMFFIDGSFSYKQKRIEYSLEAQNLLNTSVFHSAVYNDITHYSYSYHIREASVMFKIKFCLR